VNAVIPLFSTGYAPDVEEAVGAVLRSGSIASGTYVTEFEVSLGRLIGNPSVVTTSDMSVAISIALRLAGVKAGDEVIASPFACLSTNSPIALAGARLRWADIDPHTGALDIDDVRRLIGPATKAVVVYHLAGYPGPARELACLCRDSGIALIEDCDNALGATRDGSPVGSDGDHAIYSFYPNRQVNGFEGGAIACRDPASAARAARLRRFGIDGSRFRGSDGEIAHDADLAEIGWSGTMSNLHSAAALVQLDRLQERLQRTRFHARRLEQVLDALPGVEALRTLEGAEPAYWGMLARTEHRDDLLSHLKNKGILASKLHQRNDRYTAIAANHRELRGVDEFTRTALAIPCGWWLSADNLAQVEEALATGTR
jgi:dTDP-4-amino-4,6-dideoxygalactose transaminase